LKRGKWQAPKTGWKNRCCWGENLLGQPRKKRREDAEEYDED